MAIIDGNGNGRYWKVITILMGPAYLLLTWVLWTTDANHTAIVTHEDNIKSMKSDMALMRTESATTKDIIALQRDYTTLKSDNAEKYISLQTNQNKIEAAVQAAQAEVRNKMDILNGMMNDIRTQVRELVVVSSGHGKR